MNPLIATLGFLLVVAALLVAILATVAFGLIVVGMAVRRGLAVWRDVLQGRDPPPF